MKNKDLQEKLAKLPDDMDVGILNHFFSYVSIQDAYKEFDFGTDVIILSVDAECNCLGPM